MARNTTPLRPITTNINAFGCDATVFLYIRPNKGEPIKGKVAWNIATTEKTLPTSSGFTILVISERNTVVDVVSRNDMAQPTYSIHSVVQNAQISSLIIDVAASKIGNKINMHMVPLRFI